MRIELERSGGFAGVTLHASVDTDELPADQARDWEALIAAAQLPETSPAPAPRTRGPDRFSYALTVQRGGRSANLLFGETDLPESARPLVERLLERARGAERPSDDEPQPD